MLKGFGAVVVFSFLTTSFINAQTIDTLVDMGSHTLHFNILPGTGTPILFEAGNGDDGSVWSEILHPIHDATGATLITYDRAGLGKSSMDTTSINFRQEISDLESALQQLGFDQGLFVVCHSFGAFYTTAFANQSQNKITGAVFIDPALPCFFTKEWSTQFMNDISVENWDLIKQYKPGLYYVLQDLDGIAEDMAEVPFPDDVSLTVVAAELLLPMVKAHEAGQWRVCLKSFGAQPNRK